MAARTRGTGDGVLLNPICGRSYAVREVVECHLQLLGFCGAELALAAVAIDAVHLVVQPAARLAEVAVGDVAPRDREQNVVEFCLHCCHISCF